MVKVKTSLVSLTECKVQGEDLKQVQQKRDELISQGFSCCTSIHRGYKYDGDDETIVYWFDAEKRIVIE